ncbi:LemA family protein [Candidatus Gracilibacteria bacterium 28_42_T64]|nr:LemA family protein [Candidatus Gracilibacteria bacterium 28_42_T64]
MTAVYILLGAGILIAFILMAKYNGMVKLRNVRDQSFSDIDVQLKLRFNLVPNLVETVKGYAKHEQETFDMVTKARTSFLNAGGSVDAKIGADNMLAGALKSIFAVAEAYPDLKANENFIQLQAELSDIENKIASSRRFFNSATQEYNTFIQMFPNNIVAGMFNFTEETMFEIVNEEEKKNIAVKF